MASSRQVKRDDTFYQRVINRSYTRFLAKLEPVSILDLFIENEYIPYTQARDIQEIRLSTEQSREILKRVGSKGEIGYNKFKDFLKRTKQEDLVDYLQEQEALLEKDIQRDQRNQRLVKQNVIERVPPQQQTGSARRPNERELMSIAAHVGKNWELLGLSLGIPSTTIDQINLDNSTTILKVYRVLYKWREMNGQEGSVKNLLTVLNNAPEDVNIDLGDIKEVFDSNSATRRNSGNISSPQVAKDLGARPKNEPHIQTEAPVADRLSRMTINQAGDIDRGKGTASKYTVHSASLEQNASLQQDDSISDIGLKKIGNTRRNDPDVSNEFGPDMSRNASEGNVTDGQSVRERSGVDGTDATDVLYNRTQNRTAETKYQERDARTDTVSLDNVSDEPFSLGDVKERQHTDRDAERDKRLKNLFSSEDDFPGRLKELNPDNVRDLMDCCGTAIHGVGGFGEVYVSKNEIPGLCMKIAIKKVEMKKKADDLKMRSITNEKLASRTMHFGIVPLLAIGEDEDNMTFYFVTPYFEKGDLFKAIEADNERLKKGTTINLDIDARLRILFQIAAAIDFLHRPVHKFRDAIIHMDIKTLNIVLDKFYNARLIDFGLAREMKEEQHIHTTTIELPHTEGYYRTMKGDKLTKHIDYYNFGVVIRELLTGIPYYVEGKLEDDQLRHQNDLFLEDNLLEMWKYKDEPIEVANELIKLSVDCIEVDDINKVNSITILDKVKDLLKNRFVSRWTPRIEQRNGQNTAICDMCLVYDAAALKKKTTTLAAFEEDVQWAESGGMVPSEYHGTNDKAASFSTSHQNTDVEHSIDLPKVSLAAAEVTMSPVMVPSEYHETNDKAASFSTSHQNTDVEHSIDLPKVLLAAAEVTMSPVMVQSEYHETNDKAASFSTSHQNTDVEHSIDLPKVLLAAAEVTMSPVMVQSEYHETNDKAASFSTSHQNTDVEHSIDLPEVLLAAADVTMSPVKFYFPATDEEIALEIGLIAEPVNEPDEMDINDSSTNLDEVSKPLVPGNASVTDRVEDSSEPVNEQEEMDIYDSLTNSEEVSKPPVPGNASVNDRVEDSSVPVNEQEEMDINDSSSNSEEVSEPLILGNASVDDNDREEDSETDNDFNLEDPETDDSYGDPLYKPRESDMDEDIVSGSEDSDNSTVIDFYPAITGSYEKTQEEENIESLQCTEDDDVVASAETSTQSDECDLVKTLQPSGDTNSHTHSNLPEETICRDRKFPCIYIRKGNSDHGGEKKRVYDNYHCCLVCKQLKSNIRKHILSHKEHPTVKRMIQNEGKNQKEKERLMAIFRNAGDNAHNVSVCHEKKGELIVSRRVFPFDYSEYGPCSDCLEWIKMGVSATKHLDKCPASTSDKYKLTKGQMVVRSNVIKGLLAPEASEQLIANVYPIMTRDEVTEIAQKDSLIVALGNFVFRQNINNKSKRKYTTSSRMRAAARLVKFLKEKHGSTMSMSDFLNVDFFDDAVEAALNVASPNNDDLEDLKHPSAAIKAGHDIFQLADIQVGIAVQARNNAEKEEVEGFILLLKKNWSNRVGRLAKKLLRERRMLSHVKLPNPTDLQHLAEYLKEKLDEDYVSYRTTAEYSLCRLLLYNKRRSGELENTLKVNYIAKSSQMDEYDEALMGDLTELEKKILGSQELMKIEGKGQQIVPVIIPTDTTRALQYITNDAVRKSANVKEDNPYLFATTGSGPIRAYEALKRVCDEVKVTTPDAITSVNLRKYFATMTQVIGLKDHELGWLCKHLGHSVNVHKLHYRAASGYIERMNIGKLMLLQDFNVASHFKDQRLEDIHVEDILKHAEHKETTYDRLESLNDLESEPQRDASSLTMNSLIGKPKSSGSSRKKQVVRTRWTEEEEKELRILFKSNLQKCECPSKEQIAWAIGQSRKEGGKIHLRNRDNIKKKVWNMYQSKKIQDKILAHEGMCKCKINVCVSCMRNSFLSPIRCHSCDKDIKPIIGHDWAALLIAGNDTVKENANGFKEDIEAIETVITSKCPLVMGIRDTMVKKILPAKGGVNEFIKDSLKEAVSFFNKKEDLHTIFIYYSGHYYPKAIDGRNGEGFKLGGEQEYMTLEEFQSILSPFLRTSNAPKNSILSSRRLVIALDCCYTPSLLSSPNKEARGSKANEQQVGSLPKGNSEGPNLQPNSSDTCCRKNTPFFTCKKTDNYSIVQINACRHNQRTVLESDGSVFRKFLVQALTRKAMQKPCLVKAEGRQCEKDCFIPGQFVTMQDLMDYITRHMENSRSEYGQPVMHARNVSSHDAKIAYVFNSSADLRFKYTFKNTTLSRTVPQQLFNDIGQLRLHLVNEFVEVMVKKGDIKEPVPADLVDALCIQIKRGPKKKHVEELDSLQKVTGAWNSKREMLVSLREISEIRQGKVGVFLPKGCDLNSFFAERYSKKTDDTVCISYMVEFDGLRTLRKDLSNFNKDVQSYITSVIKDVEDAQKNGEIIGSKLLISFPVQGDGGTLLRDDFVYFQLE